GGINHPNVAEIEGVGVSMSTPALIRGRVEGAIVANLLGAPAARRQHGLPLQDVLRIGRQIAEAMEFAHDRGVVHRDLKPANIKVREDGIVKVLDFGLARALDTSGPSPYVTASGTPASDPSDAAAADSPTLSVNVTHDGNILGTAAYMAPEQAQGKSVDRRADIWAFGAVLFEMLTGHRAFRGETTSETLARVTECDADFGLLPPNTPRALAALLERCLTKD